MKFLCKSLMLSLMLGLAALMPTGLNAQSAPEPSIVISIAKLDEQMADVNYVLTASGFPEMKFIASAAVKGYTKGIDTKRNAGAMLYFTEESEAPDFVVFVPVSDIDDMLDVVAGFAEVDEDGDFYSIIAPDGTEILIKEQGGYAFISTKKEMFDNLPADPESQLGDLPSKFNLAAKIMPQRIPQALKDQIMDLIEEGSSQTLDNLDSEVQEELQRKNIEMQMQQIEMLLEETEELTFGMCADKEKESLYMDVLFMAVKGSGLAKKIAASKPTAPTRFSGFLMEGAAMTANFNTRMSPDDAKVYGGMMDDLKSTIAEALENDGDLTEEETGSVKEAVNELLDVLNKTMAEGVFDGGAVVMLDGDDKNIAMGMQVADPMAVQKTVKDLVPMIKEKAGDKLEVKLDVAQHKGVNFHEIVIPIPSDEEEARELIGEEFKIVLGMGNKAVYLAVGTTPNELLKRAMDETHPATDAQQFNFYVAPMLKMATKMEYPPMIEDLANKMAEVGKDRISIVTNMVENGTQSRFEMQDGILALIKVGFEAAQSGGFSDDDF